MRGVRYTSRMQPSIRTRTCCPPRQSRSSSDCGRHHFSLPPPRSQTSPLGSPPRRLLAYRCASGRRQSSSDGARRVASQQQIRHRKTQHSLQLQRLPLPACLRGVQAAAKSASTSHPASCPQCDEIFVRISKGPRPPTQPRMQRRAPLSLPSAPIQRQAPSDPSRCISPE